MPWPNDDPMAAPDELLCLPFWLKAFAFSQTTMMHRDPS
jgi:hypothetical protein